MEVNIKTCGKSKTHSKVCVKYREFSFICDIESWFSKEIKFPVPEILIKLNRKGSEIIARELY